MGMSDHPKSENNARGKKVRDAIAREKPSLMKLTVDSNQNNPNLHERVGKVKNDLRFWRMTITSSIDICSMMTSILTFTVFLAIISNTGVNAISEVSEHCSLNINEKIT